MVLFLILAAVLLLGAVGVVTLRQPVHAALSLVGTLLALAVMYVSLQAHFLAAIQVIVYAGAIMVLFLFVLMLLNVQGDAGSVRLRRLHPVAWVVGLVAAVAVGAVGFLDPRPTPTAEMVAASLRGGGAEAIGEALFTDFVLAFQLVGVLLLTGIVAAVGLVQRSPSDRRGAERRSAETAPAAPPAPERVREPHARTRVQES